MSAALYPRSLTSDLNFTIWNHCHRIVQDVRIQTVLCHGTFNGWNRKKFLLQVSKMFRVLRMILRVAHTVGYRGFGCGWRCRLTFRCGTSSRWCSSSRRRTTRTGVISRRGSSRRTARHPPRRRIVRRFVVTTYPYHRRLDGRGGGRLEPEARWCVSTGWFRQCALVVGFVVTILFGCGRVRVFEVRVFSRVRSVADEGAHFCCYYYTIGSEMKRETEDDI